MLVTALMACGDDGMPQELPPDASPDSPGTMMVMGMVGAEGGTVGEPGGPQVEVPAGAVDGDTTITVVSSSEPAPTGALTPVYRFEPDGIVFAVPIRVRLPVPDGVANASMYWTKLGAPNEFERIGGKVIGSTIEAEVVHFSGGYAGPATGTRTLTGSAVTTWGRTSGIINQATDFTSTAVTALVRDGSGGYTTIAGSGTSAGTFSIAGLPDGPVMLRIGNSYYVTAADAFDAGVVLAGRPDLVPSTSAQLNLDITNLEAWEDGDSIQILAPDADTWWFNEERVLTPTPGTTTLTGLVSNQDAMDCCGTANLIRGDLGDAVFIGQLATRQTTDTTPITYRALTRVLKPAPFTQTENGTTNISGTFADVSSQSTFSVSVDQPAFDQIVGYTSTAGYPTKLGPNVSGARVNLSISTFVDVQGVPGPDYLGMYAGSVDYALLEIAPGSPATVATGLGYGELPGWTTSLLVRATWAMRYWLPGTTYARWFYIGTDHTNLLPATGSQTVAPGLGPVENPTIDNSSLFAQQANVSLTPHLAWQAPTVGTPTVYHVRFHRLHPSNDGTTTQASLVVQFYTSDTQLDVPPDALTPGPYAILIRATTANPQAPAKARYGIDSATVASAIMYLGSTVPEDHFYVFSKLAPGGGVDVDNDGTVDNQLAPALQAFEPDLVANTATAVARGNALLLANVLSDSLVTSDAARFTTYLGANPSPSPCIDASDNTCAHHLDGTGVFEIDPNSPDLTPLVGTITAGALTAGPGELAIQLALVPDRPITLHLAGARIEYTASTSNGFVARVGGGVSQDEMDSIVLPEMEYVIDSVVTRDCVAPTSPPDCGCGPGSQGENHIQLFDSNHNCEVELAEIQSNSLIQALFASDVTIDGVPYLSYGANVEAIAGSLAP